jgi:hypothetical protein
MKQLRKHWSWSTAAAPLAFGVALTMVIASCGSPASPVRPSASGASQIAADTAEPTPTPTPTPTPDPTPDPTPTPTPTPPEGGQGCTPGYWRQSQHFDSWPAPYTPTMQFSAVFDDAFPGMTLGEVVATGGGGLQALGRHTVAALLNSASADVDYNLSTADVIAAFNAVYPDGDYEALKNRFEGFNELGCSLN